jgi:8-oxo-dGTP diphosphatase
MSGQIRVVAAVISRGDKLLVCQRPAHKRHGGLWEFPGGKCEPGESDADAIRRELAEELGVETVAVGDTECEIADPESPFLIVFVAANIDGEPVAGEHTATAWASLDELFSMPLAPSDRRYLEQRPRSTRELF